MDFVRLRTLRELHLRKTMAAVADALFLSPSAVSQQITALEHEVGANLIERRGRGVVLTPVGESLVRHADRILAAVEEAKTDIAELKSVVAGELRIAAFPSVAAVLIPPVMRSLEKEHPRLAILLDELEPALGMAALRAWQADVALIDDLTLAQDPPGENVETVELYEDRLFAVLPPEHRLAQAAEVGILDLSEERWAIDTGSSSYGSVLIRACQKAGFEPLINGRCNSYAVVSSLIRSGCSIAVLPGLRVKFYDSGLVVKALVPEIRRKIFVACRRGERRNPAIAVFVDSLLHEAGAFAEAGMEQGAQVRQFWQVEPQAAV